ncbi:hypothetical protein FHX73_149 [Kitasatospora viridis]|uniref:Uncharacterized protein n=1 Tax=Kitasatospora viridis TaxID=281105 RepID=A0A561T5Z0_9ACTN|nr:hypothetical protein FHX73_149 [Kitasatospora viridis]
MIRASPTKCLLLSEITRRGGGGRLCLRG